MIGNASVILVVTISLTSRDYILDQIQRIGSNLIYAQYESGNNTVGVRPPAADYVKIADVEAVREQLGSRIVAATGVMNSFDRMRIQGGEEDVAIIGVGPILSGGAQSGFAGRDASSTMRTSTSGIAWRC